VCKFGLAFKKNRNRRKPKEIDSLKREQQQLANPIHPSEEMTLPAP